MLPSVGDASTFGSPGRPAWGLMGQRHLWHDPPRQSPGGASEPTSPFHPADRVKALSLPSEEAHSAQRTDRCRVSFRAADPGTSCRWGLAPLCFSAQGLACSPGQQSDHGGITDPSGLC